MLDGATRMRANVLFWNFKHRNITMNNKYFLLYVIESTIYTYVCQNVNVHVASSKLDMYILMIVKIQFYKKAEI